MLILQVIDKACNVCRLRCTFNSRWFMTILEFLLSIYRFGSTLRIFLGMNIISQLLCISAFSPEDVFHHTYDGTLLYHCIRNECGFCADLVLTSDGYQTLQLPRKTQLLCLFGTCMMVRFAVLTYCGYAYH